MPEEGAMKEEDAEAAVRSPRWTSLAAPVARRPLLVLALVGVAFMASMCTGPMPGSLSPDLILLNGKVVTLDDAEQIAEAVAVKGEHIAAVGSTAAVRGLAGPNTEVIDLEGRLALPGLVDAHSHTGGVPPDYLDLYGEQSIEGIQDAISEKAATTPPGEWIVGSGRFMIYSGWDENRLEEKRWLTRRDIDPVSPEHPVLLIKDGGHAVVLNSQALRRAGITKDTPDPKKQIVRDPETGALTGALLRLASEVTSGLIPAPTRAQRLQAAANASRQLLAMGTTTVVDAATDGEMVRVYQSLYAQETGPLASLVLSPHVPMASPSEAVEFVRSWPVTTGFGDHRLKLGALKIFVDGGVTNRTAWFENAYRDRPDYHGTPEVDRETLFETVRLADRIGWQIHFHTCGDAAAELVLQALEDAQKRNETTGRRHALTHLYVLSADQIARMRALGVVAVLQPNFVYSLGEHMRAVLPDEQLEHLIPFRSLLDAGVPVALSADGHPQEPLYGVYAAVARETETGHVLGPGEAVTVLEALRAYTRASAYSIFEEDRLGSLEPGKLAELIVLDRDVLTVAASEIKEARVLLTIKNGEVAVDRLTR
jgi:predicted amidohydrolase YtcJ